MEIVNSQPLSDATYVAERAMENVPEVFKTKPYDIDVNVIKEVVLV